MAKRKKSPPSYRLHRQSGQAVVTLRCTVSGKRRDVLLGEHDTAESWAEYSRVIAEWEAAGRVLDSAPAKPAKPGSRVTVAEVMLDWWEGVLKRYGVTDPDGRLPSRLYSQRSVVRLVRATCGSVPAAKFGPMALQEVRQKMVDRRWSRGHVNQSVATIIRAFKQAVAREVVTPEAVVALQCVKPLGRGELGAREGEKIKPAALAHIEAVKPHLSRQAVAIIDVMLLTGARCDEIVRMRPVDIDVSGKVWIYRPDGHKGEHRGHERLIHIGPKAQDVIRPFLETRSNVEDYLFSPAEAEAERRKNQHDARVTPLSCGNRPGSNRTEAPKRKATNRYTTDSLRRAIDRACDMAFPPPDELARRKVPAEGRKKNAMRWETDQEWKRRLGPKREEALKAWRRDHRWTPHQLRHTAATEIRRAAGVEAAALVLGHASATLTDAVYAERDHAKAAEVIARVG